MEGELKEAFGADVELTRESKGIFDVTVDGHLLFSKHAVDRFPVEGEVVKLIRQSRSDV